jgi:hypothetical protein
MDRGSCAQDGSFESDIVHPNFTSLSPSLSPSLALPVMSLPQTISAAAVLESELILRQAVDAIYFFQCHAEQFMNFFSQRGVDVVLKADTSRESSRRNKHKLPNIFHLKGCVKENIEFVEHYLNTLPSKLQQPMQRVFRDATLDDYQRLVAISSRIMSCIRSHYSYKQRQGEEDPLSSELNISIRMKPTITDASKLR